MQDKGIDLSIKLLMDLLIHLDINKLPPVIIELLISNLETIEPFIVRNKEISDLWIRGKMAIPLHNLEELKKISKSLKYTKVSYLLNRS